MKKLLLASLIGVLISSLAFGATEIRMTGMYSSSGLGVTGDHRLGNTCVVSPGGRTYCGLNASHLSFFADNTISLERLYRFALVYSDNNSGYFLRSGGDNTFSWAAPPGAGTVTGPTTVTADNIVTWGTDNTTIKDSGVALSTLTAKYGANDNAVLNKVTFTDNTFLTTATKTLAFGIDNIVATDNVLLFRAVTAITITRADCYASYDNVVGSLMECATDNVLSCSVIDSWSVVKSGGTPFSDTSMTDGAVAAGAWVRWSTTSVGTASSNSFACTVRFKE